MNGVGGFPAVLVRGEQIEVLLRIELQVVAILDHLAPYICGFCCPLEQRAIVLTRHGWKKLVLLVQGDERASKTLMLGQSIWRQLCKS